MDKKALMEELEQLGKLYQSGVFSQAEFEAQRSELLEQLRVLRSGQTPMPSKEGGSGIGQVHGADASATGFVGGREQSQLAAEARPASFVVAFATTTPTTCGRRSEATTHRRASASSASVWSGRACRVRGETPHPQPLSPRALRKAALWGEGSRSRSIREHPVYLSPLCAANFRSRPRGEGCRKATG